MRYDDQHESDDVIDRRGEDGGGGPALGGGGGGIGWLLFAAFRFLGIPGVLVVGALYIGWTYFLAPRDSAPPDTTTHKPLHHQDQAGGGGAPAKGGPVGEERKHFVAYVLDDSQKAWTEVFAARGKTYRHAKLVLFTRGTETGCGFGRAAQGPFYCPGDERVYLDLDFFDELAGQLGAKGEFAEAYVVAHEIGHHVQKLLGISDHIKGDTERGANGNSVRMELQADCFAGIWTNATKERSVVDAMDIESALNAAHAIGDDKLQREARGNVRPETFTHGTSAQRAKWWKRGMTNGKIEDCDTFSASQL